MKTFKFGLLVNVIESATQARVTVDPELFVKQNGKPAIIIQVHNTTKGNKEESFEAMMREVLGISEPVVGIAVTMDDELINKLTYPGFPEAFSLKENHDIIKQCTVYGVSRDEKHAELMIGLAEE